MIKIAHRGNTNGPSIHENQLSHIQNALDKGFDVEVDVWMIRGKLWTGHDSAQYLVAEEYLINNMAHLWIHCKNFEALDYFSKNYRSFNYFWHQEDDFAITSQGFIWTYPNKQVGKNSVIVDLSGEMSYTCYAICSDYLTKD